MKIRFKIVLLICVNVLVVALTIGFISYTASSKTMHSQVEAIIPQIAADSGKIISANLTNYISILEKLALQKEAPSFDWPTLKPVLQKSVKESDYLQLAVADLNGRTILDDGPGAKISDREYFVNSTKGKTFISEIINDKTKGIPIMVISVPMKVDGHIVGIVFGILDANWLHELTKNMGYGKEGYAYIIDNTGTLIAHDNEDYVKEKRNFLEEGKTDPDYKMVSLMLEKMVKGETGFDQYYFMGSDRFFGYAPIPNTTWSIAVGAYKDEVFKGLYNLRNYIFLVVGLMILIGIIIGYYFSGTITKPLKDATLILQDISEGEGDLTKRLVVKSKDETSLMASYINTSFEKIAGLMTVIKKESIILHGVGDELAANMTETAAAINQINANIQSLQKQTINQSASVVETSATMEQIQKGIGLLNSLIEDQSANVTQSSASIEEMTANIDNVHKIVGHNTVNTANLLDISKLGRSSIEEVNNDIVRISKESQNLLEISSIIQDIASQTSLLAMNAAIEAAHAGESGKGFAVVADEVRKLAESSTEQSKFVSSSLQTINKLIDKIEFSNSELVNQFSKMETLIILVSDQELLIKNAMEEQTEGNKQVLEAIKNLNNITKEVQSNSFEILTGSKQIIKETSNLQSITEELKSGMTEMAGGAHQISDAVNSVNGLSNKNKLAIQKLEEELNKFIIE